MLLHIVIVVAVAIVIAVISFSKIPFRSCEKNYLSFVFLLIEFHCGGNKYTLTIQIRNSFWPSFSLIKKRPSSKSFNWAFVLILIYFLILNWYICRWCCDATIFKKLNEDITYIIWADIRNEKEEKEQIRMQFEINILLLCRCAEIDGRLKSIKIKQCHCVVAAERFFFSVFSFESKIAGNWSLCLFIYILCVCVSLTNKRCTIDNNNYYPLNLTNERWD